MFWSQNLIDPHHPKMAYQAMSNHYYNTEHLNQWNGISIEQAHILHFHASRGSLQVINIMKALCEKLEITV
jgi:hypothetical protein